MFQGTPCVVACENFAISKMQTCIIDGLLYRYTVLLCLGIHFKTVVSDMLGSLNAVYITYV